MLRNVWWVMVAVGILGSLTACLTPREMYTQPSPNLNEIVVDDEPRPRESAGQPTVSTGTHAKVTVSARLVAGTASTRRQDATAIHLTIDNRGDKPLRLGHAQLSLATTTGRAYPALPLRKVGRTTTGRADTVDEFLDSTIDPQSHDRAVAAKDAASPILEGVVDPREHVAGMVYFEQVPAEARPMRLVIQLVDARNDTPIGRIELPMPSAPNEKPVADSSQLEDTSDPPPD